MGAVGRKTMMRWMHEMDVQDRSRLARELSINVLRPLRVLVPMPSHCITPRSVCNGYVCNQQASTVRAVFIAGNCSTTLCVYAHSVFLCNKNCNESFDHERRF